MGRGGNLFGSVYRRTSGLLGLGAPYDCRIRRNYSHCPLPMETRPGRQYDCPYTHGRHRIPAGMIQAQQLNPLETMWDVNNAGTSMISKSQEETETKTKRFPGVGKGRVTVLQSNN